MKILGAILITAFATPSFATTYFLSSKGDDSKSGTSSSAPWRTLERLSEKTSALQPGDSILLERGSVFTGTLSFSVSGLKEKPIFVGAYGSGAKPIIKGSIGITNWVLYHRNIWVAKCEACEVEPGDLFIDGAYQPLGRYPNDGYLTLSCPSKCTKTLTDNQQTFEDGYWDNAEVVVRSSRWTLDRLSVSNYFNKTFYFSEEASYPIPNGNGYFIQNHLSTLDLHGEWFFDTKQKKIFLYCANGFKPENHVIEISTIENGLSLNNSNFITIQDLAISNQRTLGISASHCSNVTMRNCDVDHSGKDGIKINSCQSPLVENCTIKNSSNNGVEWHDNTDGTFIRNTIRRSGLHAGRGVGGNGTYIALSIPAAGSKSSNNLFQYNSIDSTGYTGIDFRTGATTIKNNLVSNFCLVKDDGAGIYTWGNSLGDNSIERNIVVHGMGAASGTGQNEGWAHGIYIDDRSSGIDIYNNTVAYCGASGVFIHNAKQISLRNNQLIENGVYPARVANAQLRIQLDGLVNTLEKALSLHVTENLFVTTRDKNYCVFLSAEKEHDLDSLGSFDRNRFVSPTTLVVTKFYAHQELCDGLEEIDLAQWQRIGNDARGVFKNAPLAKESQPALNFVKNGNMTNGTAGWISWPDKITVKHDKHFGNNPSLKAQFPSGKSEGLLYYAGISLSAGKWYRLSFSAMSTTKTKIEFVPMMSAAPWESLDRSACFSVGTAFRSYCYLFSPHSGNKQTRINFKSNATFWIDNVSLTEIPSSPPSRLEIIYNACESPTTIPITQPTLDVFGNLITNSLVVDAYGAIVLQRN